MYNGFWLYFWIAALLIAGGTFAAITVVVAIKGGAELIAMFRSRK
ncbi:MAG TPA: hypothetical protein VN709_08110 [Terriglobales bacterium]|jgi:hypothetical protein|nr:hypothetical protein [Terriglobales bacterium]